MPRPPRQCAAQRAYTIRIHVPGTDSEAVAVARRFGINVRAAAIRRVALASIFASRSCRVDLYVYYTRAVRRCNKRNLLTSSTRSSSSLYYTAFRNCTAKRSSLKARQSSAKKKERKKLHIVIVTSELERWIGSVEEPSEQLQPRSSLRDSVEEHPLLRSL
uniref:Uncharacterized protein n=1 Tax=Trichogramma kaykai TaxID=54128 RepID=A0ABD2WDI2_9HYME